MNQEKCNGPGEVILFSQERAKRLGGNAVRHADENIYPDSIYQTANELWKDGLYYANGVPPESFLSMGHSWRNQSSGNLINLGVPRYISDSLKKARLYQSIYLEYSEVSPLLLSTQVFDEIEGSLEGRFPRVKTADNTLTIHYVTSDQSESVHQDRDIYALRTKVLLKAESVKVGETIFRHDNRIHPQPAKFWHPYDFMDMTKIGL